MVSAPLSRESKMETLGSVKGTLQVPLQQLTTESLNQLGVISGPGPKLVPPTTAPSATSSSASSQPTPATSATDRPFDLGEQYSHPRPFIHPELDPQSVSPVAELLKVDPKQQPQKEKGEKADPSNQDLKTLTFVVPSRLWRRTTKRCGMK